MSAEVEFAELELTWVRQVRKTRNPDLLHLVESAVKRERELIEFIANSRPVLQLMAADEAPPYGPSKEKGGA